MSTYGDPGFNQHRAMGQYLALVAFHLADDEVLPIDVQTYATELRAYRDDLVDFIAEAGVELDISELNDAIEVFATRADEVKTLENTARTTKNADSIRLVNHKYAQFQRGFVSQGGLPDREFYKHVVAAPGLDTGKLSLTSRKYLRWLTTSQVTLLLLILASLKASNMIVWMMPRTGSLDPPRLFSVLQRF